MSITWKDLDEPINCFTIRNAKMMDLRKRTEIQQYSANTKIVVVQKCILPEGTFYRTKSAKERGLDWAFRASAFGLPDDKAPSVPSNSPETLSKPATRTHRPEPLKQKNVQKTSQPKDGEAKRHAGLLKRLLRRMNG